LLVWGRISASGLVRYGGIGFVLIAIAKLLVLDTATAGPVMRMALFAGIGTALLVVGYWLARDAAADAGGADLERDDRVPTPEPHGAHTPAATTGAAQDQ
jgi:uncharacterized membrane protein